MRAVPPVAPPGATYHYSNANYIVLGAILQRLTHESLGRADRRSRHQAVTTHAHAATAPTTSRPRTRSCSTACSTSAEPALPSTSADFRATPRSTVDPAGAGLFSSLPDLLTVTHALFATDDVLAAAQRSALDRAVSTLSAKDLLLGNSFVIHGHGGASPGAQTIVAYDRTHDATVAVWCNRLDPGEYELLPSVIVARDDVRARHLRDPALTSGQRPYHERTGTPRRVSGGDGRDGRDGYVGCVVAPPAPESGVVRRRDRGDRRVSALPRGPRHRPSRALRRSPRPSPTCRTPPSRSPVRRATAARRCSPTGPPANRATGPSQHPATADRRPSASVGSRSVGCTRARWPRGTDVGLGPSSAPSAPFIPQLSDHRAVPGPPTFALATAEVEGVRVLFGPPAYKVFGTTSMFQRGVHVEQRRRAGVGAQGARWPDPRRAPHAGQDLHVLRAGAEPVRVGLTLAAFECRGAAALAQWAGRSGDHVGRGRRAPRVDRVPRPRARCRRAHQRLPRHLHVDRRWGAGDAFGRRSPVVVLGLSAGKTYTCTVTAHDSVGYGTASAPSGSVVPLAH